MSCIDAPARIRQLPLLGLDRVFQSRKIIARKLHHPEIPHPFFRGKWDPDTLFFTCLINCQMAECPRFLSSVSRFFLLSPVSPPRFHAALSVPKVPICEQPPAPVTVHTYADCNRILPMLRIPNRQNLLPPRFHTALSVPKVPICEHPPALLFSPPDRSDTSSGPSFLPKELLFPLFPL